MACCAAYGFGIVDRKMGSVTILVSGRQECSLLCCVPPMIDPAARFELVATLHPSLGVIRGVRRWATRPAVVEGLETTSF